METEPEAIAERAISVVRFEGAPKRSQYIGHLIPIINKILEIRAEAIEFGNERAIGKLQVLAPLDYHGDWPGRLEYNFPSLGHHLLLHTKLHGLPFKLDDIKVLAAVSNVNVDCRPLCTLPRSRAETTL